MHTTLPEPLHTLSGSLHNLQTKQSGCQCLSWIEIFPPPPREASIANPQAIHLSAMCSR
eukprot:m.179082 g.179082  ORF g.179082 m.179082 type:complete len:59 (+) comp16599_c0_seq8:1146-1322(+)